MLKKALSHMGLYIEEIILALIILLNIVDFLEMISPEWDYIKKIISWTALGYLLYKASLTKLFFGERHKFFDATLIIAYFLMTMKNFVNYAHIAQKEMLDHAHNILGFARVQLIQPMEVITITVNNLSNLKISDFTQEQLHHILTSVTLINHDVLVRVTDGAQSEVLVTNLNSFLLPFINTIVMYAHQIDKYSFIMGASLLIILSIYFAYVYKVRTPSLLHVIHEEGKLNTPWKIISRPFVVFIVMVAFFIVVFNLMMEWLAIAIDAPLIVIALFTYLLYIIKHHEKFQIDSLLFKIGNFGERFYESFVDHFHTKHGLILGVIGMLVLHLLTDVGNYLVPYLIHVHDLIYFEHLGAGHQVIFNFKDLAAIPGNSLLLIDVLSYPFPHNIAIFTGYILNIIAIIFLLTFPAYIWYCMYKRRAIRVPFKYKPILFSSLIFFFISPIFAMQQIRVPGLIGVDILTHSLLSNPTPLYLSLGIAAIVLITTLAINRFKWFHDHLVHLLVMASLVFFVLYMYYYLMSFSSFLISAVISQLQIGGYFIGTFFSLFFMTSIIFYVVGTLLFLWQLRKVYMY